MICLMLLLRFPIFGLMVAGTLVTTLTGCWCQCFYPCHRRDLDQIDKGCSSMFASPYALSPIFVTKVLFAKWLVVVGECVRVCPRARTIEADVNGQQWLPGAVTHVTPTLVPKGADSRPLAQRNQPTPWRGEWLGGSPNSSSSINPTRLSHFHRFGVGPPPGSGHECLPECTFLVNENLFTCGAMGGSCSRK